MRVAIVGCGFVADYYHSTLAQYGSLELVGVHDRVKAREDAFAARTGVKAYGTLGALLADPAVEMVLNLTNPRSHYEVSRAALLAGKHVYSEKPLGMTLAEAEELVHLAKERGCRIAAAPCSLLGETAQTIWRALRGQAVGKVRLVYAEMDDGMVHQMPYRKWLSASGKPWPYKDEFEVGCTVEHAGYYLTWLTAFFGPAEAVTAFSSCLIPEKCPGEALSPPDAADFSVGLIKFRSGVVARITCGIVAPHDHSLKIIGDQGVLGTDDSWFYRSPVYVRRMVTIRRRSFFSPLKQRVRLLASPLRSQFKYKGAQQMDFSRGVYDLAEAVRTGRGATLSEDFSLHNTELTLAIHNAMEFQTTVRLKSSFAPVSPAPWSER